MDFGNNQMMSNLAKSLFGAMSPADKIKFNLQGATVPSGAIIPVDAINTMNPEAGLGLSNLSSLALGAAKAHPFKAAGAVGLGLGNIGGLTDNNKFGGQLGGLALGGLGAKMLASGNPYAAAMLTLGGGELGALFDKLRAKKEQEQALPQYQPYQQ